MMTQLKKLLSEVLFIKAGKHLIYWQVRICCFFHLLQLKTSFAVVAVSNFACGLYNRRLYDQAFTLVEILCKSNLKDRPTSLPVDRVSFLCEHIESRP